MGAPASWTAATASLIESLVEGYESLGEPHEESSPLEFDSLWRWLDHGIGFLCAKHPVPSHEARAALEESFRMAARLLGAEVKDWPGRGSLGPNRPPTYQAISPTSLSAVASSLGCVGSGGGWSFAQPASQLQTSYTSNISSGLTLGGSGNWATALGTSRPHVILRPDQCAAFLRLLAGCLRDVVGRRGRGRMSQSRIAICGEAYGADEEAASLEAGEPRPFVGASGKLLDAMLKSAGIDRAQCLVTNVLCLRPPGNDFASLLVPKKLGIPGWPALQDGKYYPPELMPELERFHRELAAFSPDVIIALGSKALWALCKVVGLKTRHGFSHQWTAWAPPEGSAPPTLVVPTWHPAAVIRAYSQFLPAVNDMRKARMLAEGTWEAEVFSYLARPSLQELREYRDYILGNPDLPVAIDIETKPRFRGITHAGASTVDRAICCPLWDPKRPGQS